MAWETTIGLEVHIQLKTNSKLFSTASTVYGADPNTQACSLDLGLPGLLPVANQKAIDMAVRFGLSVAANIDQCSFFSRKHYWYPDLPKGYQITQHSRPIIKNGQLPISLSNGETRFINIERAHLEEDAGKLLHHGFHGNAAVDFNRAGTALLEIVSAPELHSPEEAVAYLKTLHRLVRYLDICDGNMQEGSFRCDVNVSIRPTGQTELGTRTETKNLNSFRFVERAIIYEVQRQIALTKQNEPIHQETRLFNPDTGKTYTLRSKEDAEDYAYFPDPDLLPITITDSSIAQEKEKLPELPWVKQARFIKDHHLNPDDAQILTAQRATADYFEETLQYCQADEQLVAHWIIGELFAALHKAHLSINNSPINPQQLAKLLNRLHDTTISNKIAKIVFEAVWNGKGDPDAIIEEKGLQQITDNSLLERCINELFARSEPQIAEYKAGNKKVFTYFVGQIMKATQGKANPAQVNLLLREKLRELYT